MSEEMKELQTNEVTETMADYEDHFDDANPWNRVQDYMDKKTVLPVKIEGVVNGGVIVMVEGLRGFVPASKLSLSYIENLEDYLLKDIEVQVIDVDQANNRLVLSARELLKEKEKAARDAQIASMKVGTVLKGTVETLQNYGAFVKLENGLSGLVHVSQISQKRVKMPSDVLTVGDEVEVKVIGIKDGKISLSMKALEEDKEKAEEKAEKVVIPKAEDIGLDPDMRMIFLPGGKTISDGSDLLGTELMGRIIEKLEEISDFVILDSAPAGLLTDAVVLAQYADGAAFVVRKDFARVDYIMDGMEHLAESNIQIIGGILNGV